MGPKYEVVAGYDNDRVIAKVWWDGKQVTSDDSKFLEKLKHMSKRGEILGDMKDPEFLQHMANYYKSGYLYMRRAK